MSDRLNHSEDPIKDLLRRLKGAGDGGSVSVSDLVKAAGDHSFATLLFAVALIMVTPISGVPLVPTIGATVIVLIVGQWILGREALWLPDWTMRRTVQQKKFADALDWAEKPARTIDRHTHARWSALVRRPVRYVVLLTILAIVVTWPFLELLPFFTTVTALGVALLAFGLMAYDGLWIILGYVYLAALVGVGFWVI